MERGENIIRQGVNVHNILRVFFLVFFGLCMILGNASKEGFYEEQDEKEVIHFISSRHDSFQNEGLSYYTKRETPKLPDSKRLKPSKEGHKQSKAVARIHTDKIDRLENTMEWKQILSSSQNEGKLKAKTDPEEKIRKLRVLLLILLISTKR